MFDFQRQIRLKQAENAFRDGRLDEAFAIASEKEIRDLRGGQILLEGLVDPLLERAATHFGGGRLREALLDVERAISAGGNRPKAAQLRKEVRDVIESKERDHRFERQAIESARAHLQHGSLRTGLQALENAPPGSAEAEHLRREVECRDRRAAEARARSSLYLKRADVIEALTALGEAVLADPRHGDLADLKARAKQLTVEKIDAALQAGDLKNARDLNTRLTRAVGESLETRRFADNLSMAHEAAQAFLRSDLTAATVAMARLKRDLPKAEWINESCRELDKAVTAIAALRSGPLGQPASVPIPRRNPAQNLETVAQNATREQMAHPQSSLLQPTASTQDRLLLWVDGVGTYLLLRGDRISFGRSGSSSHPDIALGADISGFHAEIVRTEDDYFVVAAQGKVEVGGQGVTRKLLTNGDSILLGGGVKLLFELPTPLSPSAVLTLKNQRIEADVRRVVLLKSNLLIGPGENCHVQVSAKDSRQTSVVLSAEEGGIVCRADGEILLGGQPAGREAAIPLGTHVQIGEVTFTITGSVGSKLTQT